MLHKPHQMQGAIDAQRLRQKHTDCVMFGNIDPLDLVMRLAFTSDRMDMRNGVVAQFVHWLQVFRAMQRNGVTDREFLFAAIVRDIGKLADFLEVHGNVAGCTDDAFNWHEVSDGGGLDALVIPYDHHDFGADKLRPHISNRVYRIMRYHCFPKLYKRHPDVERVMTQEEKGHVPELVQFFAYDALSKSMWMHPNVDMGEVQSILREFLPAQITF
eukprot:TRINITY_DN30365_c0_g1_i1.p2 TRINITY_DN30365_c0_g1~~TRINITY_DN30365_c0_g1_i1.p2  ORF type:complete len:215 (+),score=28.12 TRINITY_DN30365_c0_g1_i1:567-1211(+)